MHFHKLLLLKILFHLLLSNSIGDNLLAVVADEAAVSARWEAKICARRQRGKRAV